MQSETNETHKTSTPPRSSPVNQSSKPIKNHPIFLIRFLFDADLIGGLIGYHGKIIRGIRKLTSASVDVKPALNGTNKRIVHICGSYQNVCNACSSILNRILDVVKESRQHHHEHDSSDSLNIEFGILVGSHQIGAIIGKKGANVKAIRRKSKATINVETELMPNSNERCVYVSGPPESLVIALEQILLFLNESPDDGSTRLFYIPGIEENNGFLRDLSDGEYGEREFRGRSGFNDRFKERRREYKRFRSGLNEETITVPYPIKNAFIGAVIGRAGTHITEIRLRSCTKITVDDKKDELGQRIVTVTGTPARVRKALCLIQQFLKTST